MNRVRLRRLIKKLAMALAVVTVVLVLLVEIFLRFILGLTFPMGDVIELDSQDEQLYRLKPSINYVYKGMFNDLSPTTVKTNTSGYRDTEFSKEPSSDALRILFFSDSFGFGSGVKTKESLADQLEALLAEKGQNCEIYNFSMPGFNALQSIRLAEKITDEYPFERIIFYFNDTDLGDRIARPGPVVMFVQKYIATVRMYYLVIRPLVLADREANRKKAIEQIELLTRKCPAQNILIIDGSSQNLLPGLKNRLGILYLDVSKIHSDPSYYLSEKDSHLIAAGYKAIADKTISSISEQFFSKSHSDKDACAILAPCESDHE